MYERGMRVPINSLACLGTTRCAQTVRNTLTYPKFRGKMMINDEFGQGYFSTTNCISTVAGFGEDIG